MTGWRTIWLVSAPPLNPNVMAKVNIGEFS